MAIKEIFRILYYGITSGVTFEGPIVLMVFSIQDMAAFAFDTVEIEEQPMVDLDQAGQFHKLMWAKWHG